MTTTTTTDSEPVSKAIALLQTGNPLVTILGSLVKTPTAEVSPISKDVPKRVVVTETIQEAVRTLGLNIAGHQHLTVAEQRPLTQTELDTLSAERDALDAIEKYVKARKEAHKTMLYNHWDAEILAGDGPKPALDDSGRFLTKVSTNAQGGSRHFDRQMAEGKPYITETALKEVAESGEIDGFDHQAYLACTTETRVFDEEKTLIRMRNHQPTIEALREACKMGAASTSFYHRDS